MTTLTHLQRLEAESIDIMREAVCESEKPVMLYSIGKDSSVMLHLAMKAFYPSKLPFPLLHIDTTWKFREMYEFRDAIAKELDLDVIVYVNPEGVEMGINPLRMVRRCIPTSGRRRASDRRSTNTASMPRSAARGATRRSRVPRSASSRSGRRSIAGTRRCNVQNCGVFTMRAGKR